MRTLFAVLSFVVLMALAMPAAAQDYTQVDEYRFAELYGDALTMSFTYGETTVTFDVESALTGFGGSSFLLMDADGNYLQILSGVLGFAGDTNSTAFAEMLGLPENFDYFAFSLLEGYGGEGVVSAQVQYYAPNDAGNMVWTSIGGRVVITATYPE